VRANAAAAWWPRPVGAPAGRGARAPAAAGLRLRHEKRVVGAVRIGFIGVGRRMTGHIRRIRGMAECEIVGFCDLAAEAAQARAAEFGGRSFTDARQLLETARPEAVLMGLPPFGHGDPEAACIDAGVPFWLEKPVHLDIAAAREIAARASARRLVTAVGYQERYLDIVQRLEVEVAARRPGIAFGYWMGGSPSGWWVRREKSGGQAVEQTTHVFDLARHLFGPARRVYAAGITGLIPPDGVRNIEDASAATVEFVSGAVAVVTSACYLQVGQNVPAGLDVFCRDANLRYQRRRSLTLTTAEGSVTWTTQNDSEQDMLVDFLAAVRSGDPGRVRCPYIQGVEAVELSLAVNRALDGGRPVELPL